MTLSETLLLAERSALILALHNNQGHRRDTAQELGIHVRNLMRKMNRHRISFPDVYRYSDEAKRKKRWHLSRVTPSQREVWRGLAAGLTMKQIADEAGLSVSGVEYHRSELQKWLKADNVADLTRLAMEHGILNHGRMKEVRVGS